MHTEELKFAGPDEAPQPSPDLWQRIARAHLARRAQRRRLQLASAGSCAAVALALAFVMPLRSPSTTDWQARAQALEIELRALPAARMASDSPAALEAESRLMQVDGALQAAYDRGASANEVGPLWKERSELLSTLLAVRQENVAVTQI